MENNNGLKHKLNDNFTEVNVVHIKT